MRSAGLLADFCILRAHAARSASPQRCRHQSPQVSTNNKNGCSIFLLKKKKCSSRRPISWAEQMAVFRAHWPGLLCLAICNFLQLGFRCFRDYFAREGRFRSRFGRTYNNKITRGAKNPNLNFGIVLLGALDREPSASDYLMADWPGGVMATVFLLAISRFHGWCASSPK